MSASFTPQHIAVIMDGNGRWAERRLLPRISGHRAGIHAVRRVVRACARRGVKFLSLFVFSTENWERPQEEVAGLMTLLAHHVQKEKKDLMAQGIAVRVLGSRERLSKKLQTLIAKIEAETAMNSTMTLILAIDYGGQWDILQAIKKMLPRFMDGSMRSEDLTAEFFSEHLETQGIPDPDLLIRSSGEIRLSNFFLWQSAYTEFYFSDRCWPDVDEALIDEAIDDYSKRQRRYGSLPEPILEEGKL